MKRTRRRLCRPIPVTLLVLVAGTALAQSPSNEDGTAATALDALGWPMGTRTAEDRALKQLAERQYLVLNLLLRGKLALDAGDFAEAAERWEELLALPGLDGETARVVRPLAERARSQAGSPQPATPAPAAEGPEVAAAPAAPTPALPAAVKSEADPKGTVVVRGTITGGGSRGPGGAVIWLERRDGTTPRPAPVRGRAIRQIGKTFTPRILPVTVGSKVAFVNDDPIFHNVFSLSRPNDFDSGLYKAGQGYDKTFRTPGPVQILCNIHASMLAYVVVVPSPWYGQADARGTFVIRDVPPGEYELQVWHEAAAKTVRRPLTIGPEGAPANAIRVGGDRPRPRSVPDKYGKARQVQLGY